MANTWFRMYSEFATDAKVQSMSEAMQRRLMMLFCLRCSDVTVTLSDEELAFQLRISDEDLASTKALFLKKGFIDDTWEITNWDKRQFASDSSAERTAAYRARKKAEKNQRETSQKRHSDALDTDTDTDTDKSKSNPTAKNRGDGYTPEFEDAWTAYPSRPGSSKKEAFKAWTARLNAGAAVSEIAAGVSRYAAYVAALQTEPQFIKHAATFFGPDEHYKSNWVVAPQARGSPLHTSHRDASRAAAAASIGLGGHHGNESRIIDIHCAVIPD